MYAQYKPLRTIFQPVRKCSKNRQLFEFEIFWAAQNPTEITSNPIDLWEAANFRTSGSWRFFKRLETHRKLVCSVSQTLCVPKLVLVHHENIFPALGVIRSARGTSEVDSELRPDQRNADQTSGPAGWRPARHHWIPENPTAKMLPIFRTLRNRLKYCS